MRERLLSFACFSFHSNFLLLFYEHVGLKIMPNWERIGKMTDDVSGNLTFDPAYKVVKIFIRDVFPKNANTRQLVRKPC